MQGNKGETDVENRLLDLVGEDKGGMREYHWNMYINICKIHD